MSSNIRLKRSIVREADKVLRDLLTPEASSITHVMATLTYTHEAKLVVERSKYFVRVDAPHIGTRDFYAVEGIFPFGEIVEWAEKVAPAEVRS